MATMPLGPHHHHQPPQQAPLPLPLPPSLQLQQPQTVNEPVKTTAANGGSGMDPDKVNFLLSL